MIAWWGGRLRVTNELPESPAPVMDGPGRQQRGGRGVGVPHQDKCFLPLEPGQAGGRTGDSRQSIYEKAGQRDGGARDRDRNAEIQGHGGVGRERQGHKGGETEVPRDGAGAKGEGKTERWRKGEIESESENER